MHKDDANSIIGDCVNDAIVGNDYLADVLSIEFPYDAAG